MSSIYSIYKATNTITGKSYIGFDSNWPNRKMAHKRRMSEKNNIKFYNALRKYGWDSFDWEILYQSLEMEHCLKVMEPYFISEHDTFHCGYNSTLGGEGVIGYKHNEERRKKISIKGKGRKDSEETIRKRAERNKLFWSKNKKVIPDEQRKKISNTLKGSIPWNKGLKTNHRGNSTSVNINGVEYNSKKEAMQDLKLSLYMLNKLLPVVTNPGNNKTVCNDI